MKHRLQTLLKHKLQWLVLLTALLGVSQGVWAATFSIPANTTFYVDFKNFNGSYNSGYYISVVTNSTNGGKVGSINKTTTSGCSGYVPKNDTFYSGTKVIGSIYSFKITTAATAYGIMVWSKNESSYDDIYEVNVSGTTSFTAGGLYTIMSGKTTHDGRKADCFSGSWGTYDICDFFSTPSNVLSGTNVMFYINQDYDDNALCVHNGSKYITGTYSGTNRVYYINTAKTDITGKTINVTNNCNGWTGTGSFTNVAAGSMLKTGDQGTSTVAAATLSTFSASSTSISTGTTNITLTIKGNKAKSSNDLDIYAIIYVGSTKDGCIKVSTSNQSYTLNTSSLEAGSYTIKAVLSDGTIYYLNSSTITLTVSNSCSSPSIADGGQPSTTDREYCIGEESPAKLTVTATGGVGTYSYQWKQCDTSSGTYTNVSAGSGGNTAEYTPSTATAGTLYYKCEVTNSGSCTTFSVTSNASGAYTIDAASVAGSITGGGIYCKGTTQDLTLGSYTGSIQWHGSSTSGFTPDEDTAIDGATNETYAAPISSVGTLYYKAVVKNGVCSAATTATQATVTVRPVPSGTTITGSTPVCASTTGLTYSASSTAVAGSTYSYAWTVTGTGWNVTSGATTSSATITAGTVNGTVKVTPTLTTSGKACAGSVVTKSVTVNALPSLSLGLSPSTVYPWDVATITATTTCTTSTLDWKLYQGETLISTGAGSGTYYTFKKTDNTHYTLKGISSSGSGSSVTYTVKVDGNDGTCNAAQATQNVTISAAATESCAD